MATIQLFKHNDVPETQVNPWHSQGSLLDEVCQNRGFHVQRFEARTKEKLLQPECLGANCLLYDSCQILEGTPTGLQQTLDTSQCSVVNATINCQK